MEDKSLLNNLEEIASDRGKSSSEVQHTNGSHNENFSINTILASEELSILNSKAMENKPISKTLQHIQLLENKVSLNITESSMKKSKKSKGETSFGNLNGPKIANAVSRSLSTPSINNTILDSILSNTAEGSRVKMVLESRLKSLQEEASILIRHSIENEDKIVSLEQRLKDSEQCRSEAHKKCLNFEQLNERLQKTVKEATKKCEVMHQELNTANSLLMDTKRSEKEMITRKLDLEKQLTQSLSQENKLKSELQELTKSNNDLQAMHQKEVEERREETKSAAKQRRELVAVVMKQMQLLSNLRRQVLHLKAGIAHKFTAEEVVKAAENSF